MPKDRYDFDAEFDISRFNTRTYDESILSNEPDERIAARREARKAKYTKTADVKVITPEDIDRGKVRKKRKIRTGRALLFSAVFCGVLAIVAVQGIKLTRLQIERHNAMAELKALEEQAAQLQNELAELDSQEYIENAARSELHMIKNGEVMYIVNPAPAEPEKKDGAK